MDKFEIKRSNIIESWKDPIKREALRNKRIKYSYKVISPTKEQFIITSLSKFCKEHNLSRTDMVNVSLGKRRHCAGWIVFIVGKEYLRNKYYNKYKAIDPNGNEYMFGCLSDFCKEHNLGYDTVWKHISGKYPHYKKWIFIKLKDIF